MRKILAFLFIAWSLIGQAQNGGIVYEYRATFSVQKTYSVYSLATTMGWNGAYSTPGTTTYTATTPSIPYSLGATHGLLPISAQAYTLASDYGYMASSQTAKTVFFYTTSTMSFSRTGKKIRNFTWKMANQNADDSLKVGVKIGADYYIPGAPGEPGKTGSAQGTPAGSNGNTAFATGSVTVSSNVDENQVIWHKVTGLTAGQYIALDAPIALSSVSGDITGLCVFGNRGAANTGALRIDDIEFSTVSSTLDVPASPSSISYNGSNAITFPAVSGFTDYEWTNDAGRTIATHSGVSTGTNTITIPDSIYYAARQIGVRVKATGSNTCSNFTWLTTEIIPANMVYAEHFPNPGTTANTGVGWSILVDTVNAGTPYVAVNQSANVLVNSNGLTNAITGYNAFWPNVLNPIGFMNKNSTNSTVHYYGTNYTTSFALSGKYVWKWEVSTSHGDVNWGTQFVLTHSSGQQYVQGTPIYQTGAGSAGFSPVFKIKRELTEGEASWYTLTINPESAPGAANGTIVVGSTPVALPTTGTITGIGILCKRATAATNVATRIDGVRLFMKNATAASQTFVPLIFMHYN